MNRQQVIYWSIALLMAGALAGVVYFKSFSTGQSAVEATAPVATGCDLHASSCTGRLDGAGSVTLSITPRPIPLIQPLQIEVHTEGMGAESVMVEFKGFDMDMGVNQFTLTKQGTSSFGGTGMLPVCVRSRMVWQADVVVGTDEGVVVFPFHFDTVSR